MIKAVSSSRLEVSFYYIKTDLCRDSKELEAEERPVRRPGTTTPTAASGSRVPETKHTHLQKTDGH